MPFPPHPARVAVSTLTTEPMDVEVTLKCDRGLAFWVTWPDHPRTLTVASDTAAGGDRVCGEGKMGVLVWLAR